nr:hypothetical protein CFP56_69506 [Quercus suber]
MALSQDSERAAVKLAGDSVLAAPVEGVADAAEAEARVEVEVEITVVAATVLNAVGELVTDVISEVEATVDLGAEDTSAADGVTNAATGTELITGDLVDDAAAEEEEGEADDEVVAESEACLWTNCIAAAVVSSDQYERWA